MASVEQSILLGGFHKCPICGKGFYTHEDYAYKRKIGEKEVVFCRYNHMRQYDMERAERAAKEPPKPKPNPVTAFGKKRLSPETEAAIEEKYRAGMSVYAISKELKIGYSSVHARVEAFKERDGLK